MPWVDPDEDEYQDAEEVRCKHCRERDLFWEEARGDHNRKKRVLVDEDGNMHDCPAFRKPVASDEDFPAV